MSATKPVRSGGKAAVWPKAKRPSDGQQWPQARPKPKGLKGRANSELRTVAPTSIARRRPQNISELRTDNKDFSSQFDDRRE
ncbi:hypothetical protein OP864_07330 [Saprospira grandis]|nr:hypothetical protein [Saprospira grandis]WBM76037.1 hypothetical protein OP864_07330 [Saprospira grandis]